MEEIRTQTKKDLYQIVDILEQRKFEIAKEIDTTTNFTSERIQLRSHQFSIAVAAALFALLVAVVR